MRKKKIIIIQVEIIKSLVQYLVSGQIRSKILFKERCNIPRDLFSKEMVENPVVRPMFMNCERFDTQKNCNPVTIVAKASDFQVVLRIKMEMKLIPLVYLLILLKTINQKSIPLKFI